MMLFTDPKTAKQLHLEAVTNPKEIPEEIELVLTRWNTSLLRLPELKTVKALAVSYFGKFRGFESLDPWFFERVAGPLWDLLQYCRLKGINLRHPALSPFNPLELFGEQFIAKYPPKKVFVEITRNCNGHCIMCLTRLKNKKYQTYSSKLNMKLSLFKAIANTLFPFAEFVDLRGLGESTFIPEFGIYLDYALQFTPQFGLVTNLSVQNDALWRKLVAHNFLLDISIDGATKATYEYIRQGLRWEHIMHNIRLLVNTATPKQLENIHLLFTVQLENVHEMPKLVELAEQLGIHSVKFAAVNPQALFDRIYKRYTKSQVDGFIEGAILKAKRIRLTFLSRFEYKGRIIPGWEKRLCRRPWEYLFVNYDGSLSPCNGFLTEYSFGRFQKEWQKAYNSPSFQALRASLGKPYQSPLCEWCNNNRRN